ncbi:hypothetical protein CR513_16884, partial [Mucuna pruriens]
MGNKSISMETISQDTASLLRASYVTQPPFFGQRSWNIDSPPVMCREHLLFRYHDRGLIKEFRHVVQREHQNWSSKGTVQSGMKTLLKEFEDVFLKDIPPRLPHLKGIEHHINLSLRATLPNRAAYKMNPKEGKEIQKQVGKLLEKQWGLSGRRLKRELSNECNAFGVGIRVMLLQEGYPIAYFNENQKGEEIVCANELHQTIAYEGGVEPPNLRTNSLQKWEDDAYMERAIPTLEGSITRSRLRRIQEEVQHKLTTLKDQEEGQEGHTLYYVFIYLKDNNKIFVFFLEIRQDIPNYNQNKGAIITNYNLHLPLYSPLKTWLFPHRDASHSIEDITICDNAPTISLISGLSIGSSCKHHSAISAICKIDMRQKYTY